MILIYPILSFLFLIISLLIHFSGSLGDESPLLVAVAFANLMISGQFVAIFLVRFADGQTSGKVLARMLKILSPFADSVEQRKFRYFFMSLLAKIADLNGRQPNVDVAPVHSYLKEIVEMKPLELRRALKLFERARKSSTRFEEYIYEFHEYFLRSPAMLTQLIELLLEFTATKGSVTPGEEQMIVFAANHFGLTRNGYARIRARFPDLYGSWNESLWEAFAEEGKDASAYTSQAPPIFHPHYSILGCNPDSSLELIKSAYRKLALEHHPDRAVAQGLPDEFVKRANAKFREIQEAYEAIMAERR